MTTPLRPRYVFAMRSLVDHALTLVSSSDWPAAFIELHHVPRQNRQQVSGTPPAFDECRRLHVANSLRILSACVEMAQAEDDEAESEALEQMRTALVLALSDVDP